MSSVALPPSRTPIVYPDSDGKPMAENTLQYQWIVKITGGLEHLFANDPDVFVAGDLFWYPVEGHPEIRLAPDTLIAFGRPKGNRGSYRQWVEGGISPQVVFEVIAPEMGIEGLRIIRPDGQPFVTYQELALQKDLEQRRANEERERAERLEAELEKLRREIGPTGPVGT
jgi:Uma2 family endonuclease